MPLQPQPVAWLAFELISPLLAATRCAKAVRSYRGKWRQGSAGLHLWLAPCKFKTLLLVTAKSLSYMRLSRANVVEFDRGRPGMTPMSRVAFDMCRVISAWT
jgi:hypothetical protein